MSNEKTAELKTKCLELATQNSKSTPQSVLKLAKEYWTFVIEEPTWSDSKTIPLERRTIGKVYTDTDGIIRRWNGVYHCPAIK